MSIALLGLIILQAYWIRHDLHIKEQQFSQSVLQAMNEIVEQVEEKENLRIVVRNILTSTDSSRNQHSTPDTLIETLMALAAVPVPPAPPAPPAPPEDLKQLQSQIDQHISHLRKPGIHRTDPEVHVQQDSTVDIRIERDVQQKEVYAFRLASEEARFDSLARETEQRVASRMRKLNTMIQKFTFQIGDRSGNVLNRIDTLTLDSIIHAALRQRSIPLTYNFAITGDGNKKLVYVRNKPDSLSVLNTPYHVKLFPGDIFKRTDELALNFPNKINFLLLGMWPMLLSSMVFTLIILIGFGYTLSVILSQKKLATIKNDFINNMTHEFKTPIATIAIANESIRDVRVNSNPEKLDYYTGVIRDENQRMLRQVEHVLQMAQIDKGELVLRRSMVDLHDIIRSAMQSMELPVLQREGNFVVELKADVHEIYGDGNHLLNVFSNLIDNAVKYSPEKPLVMIKSYNRDGNIEITVTDNGIGMTKETQKKVFDTFYRASVGNIHDVKGFGLGLAYVKAIVEMHEGSVDVQSDLGRGSTFTVILPVNAKNELTTDNDK